MNATLSRAEFVIRAVAWINRTLAPPGVAIEQDTPLFAAGFINSIRILDLIAFTERATGRQIDDRQIRMDNFRTVERIAEVFVAEAASAGGTDVAA
jgi:methoxymalonate biosynthesis acyl carrier protein